jgi:small subunit ribosomal protein S1
MSNMDEVKTDQEIVYEITEEMAGQETDQTNYEALYGETFGKSLSIGAIITGTVVQIDAENIMIDVGRKIEGNAPIKEFLDENGNISVSIGDEVEVLVLSLSGRGIRLSKERARSLKVWDDIIKAYQDKTTITGKVLNRIKGGLMVDLVGGP